MKRCPQYTGGSKPGRWIGAALTALVFAAAAQARFSFTESFEPYPVGDSVSGINGWTAAPGHGTVTDDAAAMTALTDWLGGTGCDYPLPGAAHTRALRVDGTVSNVFGPGPDGMSSLWFDMMVMPEVWTNAAPPPVPQNYMCAFYATPGGGLMAVHSSGFGPDASNQWTELTGATRDDSGWTRLTVNLLQGPDSAFYSVRMDGSEPLHGPAGRVEPSETAATGGRWFPCANFRSRLAPSGLTISGAGILDDVAVSGDRPALVRGQGSTALITARFNSEHGTISTDAVIEMQAGDTNFVSINAAAYFHILEVQTNGTPVADHDFESAPLTSYDLVWPDISAGMHVLDIRFAPDLAARDTPHWWLAMHYQTNDFDAAALSDTDGDGIPAWMEYLAGTDPTVPYSVFRILEAGVLDGTNFVIWAGGGGEGLPPFTIYRCTNLLDETWEPAGILNRSVLPRTVNNIWYDPVSPPGAFYRIGITP